MKWSSNPTVVNRDWLLQVAEETGQEVPALDKESPTLFPDLIDVWEAFILLSSSRSFNQAGPNPITVEAIYSYAKLTDMWYYEDVEEFLYLVKAMDAYFIENWFKKNGKK